MNTEYSFYYSKSQHFTASERAFYDGEKTITQCFFKGKRYTECVERGKQPAGRWEDYVLIGVGTMDDVVINELPTVDPY
jgi:hypothetical protein